MLINEDPAKTMMLINIVSIGTVLGTNADLRVMINIAGRLS
jgi:hypothetical protein